MGDITKAVDVAKPAQLSPRQTVAALLDRNKQAIGMSLPSGFNADRFSRLLLTAANTNPDLFKCDPTSFLAAGVQAAQLGLEPNDARGLAYLLPFRDKQRGMIVQLIIGYRGLIDLARRSGMVSSINAFPVYSGDSFSYELGLNPTLHHVPGDHDENPADLTHVYAVAKVNGDPQFVVLTRKQIDKTKASSRGGSSSFSPWNTHYVEMALKTAIRRLCKFLPQTVEVAQALTTEERPLTLNDMGTVITYDQADHDDAIDAQIVDTTTGELLPADGVS
jgi:recombination protein RecT